MEVLEVGRIGRSDAMARLARHRATMAALAACCGILAVSWPAVADWAVADRSYRVAISVDAAGYERYERTVERSMDLGELLEQAGASGAVSLDSLRLVERGSDGAVVDDAVPFQFESDPDAEGTGTLVFALSGQTPADQMREYELYFEESGGEYEPFEVKPQVRLIEDVRHASQTCFRIETYDAAGDFVATYYYNRYGGGFASIIDPRGNDWLNYTTTDSPGYEGVYRGIPQLGWDRVSDDPGFGHPNYRTGDTQIEHAGPLRVVLRAVSNNDAWELLWTIAPDGVRFTVERAPDQVFWFLFEGTPGGVLRHDDYSYRNADNEDGFERATLDDAWGEVIPAPRWVYFTSEPTDRSMYFIHLDEDGNHDSYYRYGTMTVFGFGRGSGGERYEPRLTQTPNRFVFSLTEGTGYDEVLPAIYSAYHDLDVQVSDAGARR